LPFLLALEDFDGTNQTATKAVCFSQRTLEAHAEIIRAESAADALIYSLREKGTVDLDYMARLTRRSVANLLDELAGRIFLNPETDRWETADEYLSGDVARKLEVVQKLNRPDLAGNLAALQAAQPTPLRPGEIHIKLGAPWIPTEIIEQFAVELLSR
jgi:N12 class adenine-specific DNA methylase